MDSFVRESKIIVDRPKGTVHPRTGGIIYPVDYGHLENTKSSDNSEIDVFVGSAKNQDLDAVICSVDLCKRDCEIKLLIGCDDKEKEAVLKIFSECFDALQGILVNRK